MEISGTGVSEDRIVALEKTCRQMDVLVKGLLDEMLDLKAVMMKMPLNGGEYSDRDFADPAVPIAVSAGTSTILRSRGARPQDAPVAPAEPQMVCIMQNDGTMKMEQRCGEQSMINSSAGYGRNRKSKPETKQDPLIFAAEVDPSDAAKK